MHLEPIPNTGLCIFVLTLCKTHCRRPALLVLYLCSSSPDCGVTTDSPFENWIRVIHEVLAPLVPYFKCLDSFKKCSFPHWSTLELWSSYLQQKTGESKEEKGMAGASAAIGAVQGL